MKVASTRNELIKSAKSGDSIQLEGAVKNRAAKGIYVKKHCRQITL